MCNRKFSTITQFLKEYEYILPSECFIRGTHNYNHEALFAIIFMASCHLRELEVFGTKQKNKKLLNDASEAEYDAEATKLRGTLFDAIHSYYSSGNEKEDYFVAIIARDVFGIDPINFKKSKGW